MPEQSSAHSEAQRRCCCRLGPSSMLHQTLVSFAMGHIFKMLVFSNHGKNVHMFHLLQSQKSSYKWHNNWTLLQLRLVASHSYVTDLRCKRRRKNSFIRRSCQTKLQKVRPQHSKRPQDIHNHHLNNATDHGKTKEPRAVSANGTSFSTRDQIRLYLSLTGCCWIPPLIIVQNSS